MYLFLVIFAPIMAFNLFWVFRYIKLSKLLASDPENEELKSEMAKWDILSRLSLVLASIVFILGKIIGL